jgi:ferredoxin
MPKVTFLNETTTVEAKRGQTIKEVAVSNGIPLHRGFWTFWSNVLCRSHGVCGSCRVWVHELTPNATSPKTFGERVRPKVRGTVRLACRAQVLGDIEVRTLPGGVMFEPKQTTTWEQDPRPSAWKDRLAKANAGAGGGDEEEGDGEAKPAAAAKPAPKPAAAAGGATPTAPKPAPVASPSVAPPAPKPAPVASPSVAPPAPKPAPAASPSAAPAAPAASGSTPPASSTTPPKP